MATNIEIRYHPPKQPEKVKTYYSNISLVDPEVQAEIHNLHKRKSYVTNTFAFLTFYGLLEAVNRVKFFSKFPLLHRTGIVLIPPIFVKILATYGYDYSIKKDYINLLIKGNTPFWANPNKVPQLDKIYFELDDDRNFEPTILHHGLHEKHLKGFYPELVLGSRKPKTQSKEAEHGHGHGHNKH